MNAHPKPHYAAQFMAATCTPELTVFAYESEGYTHLIASEPLTERPSWMRPAGQSVLDHSKRDTDGGPLIVREL